MQTECISAQLEFEGFGKRRVVAGFDGGAITSDAGGLLLRETDRALGLLERIAACFDDGRAPNQLVHSLRTLVGQRVVGLALGYEDVNDHDQLRHDPVLGLLAERLEPKRADCAVLAGKSTLNRLEQSPASGDPRYHKIAHDPTALANLFVDLFVEAHDRPPRRITLDLDATDDPVHGHQEGRFFHGYYGCYCYLPLYVFCGRHLLAAKLRPSNIDASAGAVEEVARIVGQYPPALAQSKDPAARRLRLCPRASHEREARRCARCETNRVDYVFGLARNERLVERIADELAEARWQSLGSGQPVRRFKEFFYKTRKSWRRRRRVIAKAEHLPKGANPRFIVTSLKPSAINGSCAL